MRKFLTIVVSLVCLLAVLAIILSQGKQATPLPEGSMSAIRLEPGPHMVHSHDEVFVDTSRESQAHGEFAGEPQRTLNATVWHPATNDEGPYPLVIFSHGFSSTREGGAYLGEHLASHGFVVVSADFPLTNMNAPDRPYVRDVVNQPGDISFMIDELLKQSADNNHMLAGMVDPIRIGVTGISLGGMTSTLIAYHPELGDERIGAALSIAGPTAQFTDGFFQEPAVPFLMLAGDIDAMVPYASNAEPVLEKVPGSQLITVVNGSHTGFSGPAGSLRWMDNPDALGCYIVEQNIEDDVEEPWFDLLGTPEQGIDYESVNELCLMDPLPEAMNPLRQQMITALVVRAFFESRFSAGYADRGEAQKFLSEVMPAELAEVEYAGGEISAVAP
jgi:predicted dienelactone hydrolase